MRGHDQCGPATRLGMLLGVALVVFGRGAWAQQGAPLRSSWHTWGSETPGETSVTDPGTGEATALTESAGKPLTVPYLESSLGTGAKAESTGGATDSTGPATPTAFVPFWRTAAQSAAKGFPWFSSNRATPKAKGQPPAASDAGAAGISAAESNFAQEGGPFHEQQDPELEALASQAGELAGAWPGEAGARLQDNPDLDRGMPTAPMRTYGVGPAPATAVPDVARPTLAAGLGPGAGTHEFAAAGALKPRFPPRPGTPAGLQGGAAMSHPWAKPASVAGQAAGGAGADYGASAKAVSATGQAGRGAGADYGAGPDLASAAGQTGLKPDTGFRTGSNFGDFGDYGEADSDLGLASGVERDEGSHLATVQSAVNLPRVPEQSRGSASWGHMDPEEAPPRAEAGVLPAKQPSRLQQAGIPFAQGGMASSNAELDQAEYSHELGGVQYGDRTERGQYRDEPNFEGFGEDSFGAQPQQHDKPGQGSSARQASSAAAAGQLPGLGPTARRGPISDAAISTSARPAQAPAPRPAGGGGRAHGVRMVDSHAPPLEHPRPRTGALTWMLAGAAAAAAAFWLYRWSTAPRTPPPPPRVIQVGSLQKAPQYQRMGPPQSRKAASRAWDSSWEEDSWDWEPEKGRERERRPGRRL